MSWSVGARPAASHIGMRALTSLRTSASTRFARPDRAAGWGRAARHRECRDDVRRSGAAAGLGLCGPRSRENKACARDCLEEPVPDLGVAVPEDDGYDPVRTDNPARFGECPGDGRVVVVPSAVVRRCLPRPEPFDDDFFGLLLNAQLVGRKREPRGRGVESALEPHVEEIRRIRIVDHVVVRRVGDDGRHRCVGERQRQRRTSLTGPPGARWLAMPDCEARRSCRRRARATFRGRRRVRSRSSRRRSRGSPH